MLEELAEFVKINVCTVRIFLEHFTLAKHTKRLKIPIKLTNHNSPHIRKTVRVFNVNDTSIAAFEKYMKMKGYHFTDLNKQLKELCKTKRKNNA